MFLDLESYVSAAQTAFEKYDTMSEAIIPKAQEWVIKFSDDKFKENYMLMAKDNQLI